MRLFVRGHARGCGGVARKDVPGYWLPCAAATLLPTKEPIMPVWSPLEWLEALSYLVTIVGLPFAIGVFLFEQREERQNGGGGEKQ